MSYWINPFENEETKMNIILAGKEDDRPEVIAIVDNEEDLKSTIKFVRDQAWDYYYVFPITTNEIYKGPWGIDDGKSWIEEGELVNNSWIVNKPGQTK